MKPFLQRKEVIGRLLKVAARPFCKQALRQCGYGDKLMCVCCLETQLRCFCLV